MFKKVYLFEKARPIVTAGRGSRALVDVRPLRQMESADAMNRADRPSTSRRPPFETFPARPSHPSIEAVVRHPSFGGQQAAHVVPDAAGPSRCAPWPWQARCQMGRRCPDWLSESRSAARHVGAVSARGRWRVHSPPLSPPRPLFPQPFRPALRCATGPSAALR